MTETFKEYEARMEAMLGEQAEDPRWGSGGRVHNWRNHIPEDIRRVWSTFTQDQRFLLVKWAEELASNEHWN